MRIKQKLFTFRVWCSSLTFIFFSGSNLKKCLYQKDFEISKRKKSEKLLGHKKAKYLCYNFKLNRSYMHSLSFEFLLIYLIINGHVNLEMSVYKKDSRHFSFLPLHTRARIQYVFPEKKQNFQNNFYFASVNRFLATKLYDNVFNGQLVQLFIKNSQLMRKVSIVDPCLPCHTNFGNSGMPWNFHE